MLRSCLSSYPRKGKREGRTSIDLGSEDFQNPKILFQNFQKIKPTWSELTVRHAVILRNLSTRAYEHMRTEGILRLPCGSTLERFMGSSRRQVGVTDLVKQRLFAELTFHTTSQSRACSLSLMKIRVKQRLLHVKQRHAFIGEVDYGQCIPEEAADEASAGQLTFVLSS
ncbi:hypothetical protein HPB48_000821 [Haemaphysalis longicornis]|uniref:Uncharacterized protein n=1 Tax=Haemaphysalis longicornis TaxID=44386 RepID=A0A9J6FZJ8_HAELO|nr:hypothetical protein HPB48_000821 [Haemaphysalis longicornis]